MVRVLAVEYHQRSSNDPRAGPIARPQTKARIHFHGKPKSFGSDICSLGNYPLLPADRNELNLPSRFT
jgi:hypothetical protein